MSESKGLKKSSSSTSMRSSRVREYPGRFFLFSDKNSTKQVQEIKKLLSEYGADASEIKMDFKPWIKSALIKLSKKDTAPQVFFNTKYIGALEDLNDLNTNGVLRTMIEEAKQDSNNGELLELYRNQSECFEYSPDTIYFPPPYGRGITCIINIRNKTENYAVFKIKTTNRDAYAVKPRKGVINPLETQQISITLQPSATTVSPEDKFRFEAVLLSMFSEELKKNIEMIFEKADQKMLMKKKIECSFTQPPSNFKVKQFQDGNITIEQQMTSNKEEDFTDFGVPQIDSTPPSETSSHSPESESTKESSESNELFHSVISDSQPSEIAQLTPRTPRTPRNEETEPESEPEQVNQTSESSATVVEETPAIETQSESVKPVESAVESVPEIVSKEPESLLQPTKQEVEVQAEPEQPVEIPVEIPVEKPVEQPTETQVPETVAEPLPTKEVVPPSSPVIVPAPPVPAPTPETTPVPVPVSTEEEQFDKYTQSILETVKAREVAKAETKKLIETIDKKEFEQLKQQYETLLSQLKLKDEEILAISKLKGEIVTQRDALQSQLNLKEDRINELQQSLTKERNESSKLLSSKEKRLSELESEVEQYKAIKGRPKEAGTASEEKKPSSASVKTQETPEGIPVVVVIIIALVFFLIGKIF